MQDDAIVCANFPAYVERMYPRVGGIVNWFARAEDEGPTLQHFTLKNGKDFLYPIAVSYHEDYLWRLADNFASVDPIKDDTGKAHSDDMWIARWLHASNLSYRVHRPSLVQHGSADEATTGVRSIVAPGSRDQLGHRSAPTFVGADFDALKLV